MDVSQATIEKALAGLRKADPAAGAAGAKPPGSGWQPIPGGKKGGFRRGPKGSYEYWYPGDNAGRQSVHEHHESLDGYDLDVVAEATGKPLDAADLKRAHEIATKLKAGIDKGADICKLNPPVCQGNLGVSRDNMPQILEKPIPEMLASKDPEDQKKARAAIAVGADPNDPRSLQDQFIDSLKAQGVKVTSEEVAADELHATQREIKAGKTYGMADSFLRGTYRPQDAAIIVSSDNHILDGHHRWAALLTAAPDAKMKVTRVDLPMKEFLRRSLQHPGVFRADLQGDIVDPSTPLDLGDNAAAPAEAPPSGAAPRRTVSTRTRPAVSKADVVAKALDLARTPAHVLLAKGGAPPGNGGWQPIPGGQSGGYRRPHGGKFEYWYPSAAPPPKPTKAEAPGGPRKPGAQAPTPGRRPGAPQAAPGPRAAAPGAPGPKAPAQAAPPAKAPAQAPAATPGLSPKMQAVVDRARGAAKQVGDTARQAGAAVQQAAKDPKGTALSLAVAAKNKVLSVLIPPYEAAKRVWHSIQHTAHEFPQAMDAVHKIGTGKMPSKHEMEALISVTSMIGMTAFAVGSGGAGAGASVFGTKFVTHVALKSLHQHLDTMYTGNSALHLVEKLMHGAEHVLKAGDAPDSAYEGYEEDPAAQKSGGSFHEDDAMDFIQAIIEKMHSVVSAMSPDELASLMEHAQDEDEGDNQAMSDEEPAVDAPPPADRQVAKACSCGGEPPGVGWEKADAGDPGSHRRRKVDGSWQFWNAGGDVVADGGGVAKAAGASALAPETYRPPGVGWEPIPKGKHGGFRRRGAGNVFQYWYPDGSGVRHAPHEEDEKPKQAAEPEDRYGRGKETPEGKSARERLYADASEGKISWDEAADQLRALDPEYAGAGGDNHKASSAARPGTPGKHVMLSHAALDKLLKYGTYSLISAGQNPNDPHEKAMAPDDPFFAERHKKLAAEIQDLGYNFTEVEGHYEGRERSFVVFHGESFWGRVPSKTLQAAKDGQLPPPRSENVAAMVHHNGTVSDYQRISRLGEKYNQDSVIHGHKGHQECQFTTGAHKGTFVGGDGFEYKPTADDYFTEVHLAEGEVTKFALNFNWGDYHKLDDAVLKALRHLRGV